MTFSIEEFLGKLPLPANEKWKEGVWDVEPFKKENVTLVFFAPRGTDYQTFHEEDEFYFIVRGQGELVIEEERFPCKAGDALFVAAKKHHHFENFTDDFASWAVFF
jgi:mannose-6-phosphate isomerase-like protein (cupin superfamily)